MKRSQRSPLAEYVVGLLITLFVLSGRWSPSRVLNIEPTPLLEPRLWIVVALAGLAVSPLPGVLRHRPRAMGPFLLTVAYLLFFGFMFSAIVWSPNQSLALEKGFEVTLLGVAVLSIYHLATAMSVRMLSRAIWIWMLAFTGVLGGVAVLGTISGSSRIAVLGGGPNIFGRNMGLLALATIGMVLRGRNSTLWMVAFVSACSLVILSGSRGAMVAAFAGIVSVLLFMRARVTRLATTTMVAVAVAMLLISTTQLGASAVDMFRTRFLELLVEQRYVSGRFRIYEQAWDIARENWIAGAGLASFAEKTMFPYPHNLYLEAFAETGSIGLVLIVLATLVWVFVLVSGGRKSFGVSAAAGILTLGAAQFSGDVYDTRGFFAFSLLSAILVAEQRYLKLS